MVFEWDDAKHERNRAERGFGFDVASLIFKGDVIEAVDDRRDYGETRMRALGEVAGLIVHVVYTDRGEVRRIISARVASREERERWHVR